ncbi:hypothetical protein GCM10009737_09700 [Nocardioides lentus]|uniref:Type I phosphodiesterase / nucleotide pyrophosphatase n=1 Tax=Nocardioides lentus TaxID=338077 RepID=A0ABP5AIK6_9ACTN
MTSPGTTRRPVPAGTGAPRRARVAALLVLAGVAVSCAAWPGAPGTEPPEDGPSARATVAPAGGEPEARVVAVSVDGLTPEAIEVLGRRGAPAISFLLDRGAGTLDARTAVEQTVTLPNHVGMITGRRIDRDEGGHGVTWNDDVVGPVVPPDEDGRALASVFTVVAGAGGSTALFSGKTKFAIFERTWPDAVDRSVVAAPIEVLARRASRDVATGRRTFTFLHLADPDLAGHRSGWMSAPYLRAVRRADRALGRVLAVLRADADLRATTTVVLTADHGGAGRSHEDPALASSYTVPFVVWGPGVPRGDLYDLAPGLQDPGDARPGYGDPPPVRNCDLADVATTLLGLGLVPGSDCTAATRMEDLLTGGRGA